MEDSKTHVSVPFFLRLKIEDLFLRLLTAGTALLNYFFSSPNKSDNLHVKGKASLSSE